MKAQYENMGYLPPVRIVSESEAHSFLAQVQHPPQELPLDWEKGYAASSRLYYEMATHPAIMERVTALIGPDVMLWGCSIVARTPGATHAWHCDLEASAPKHGKTLNVWLGLKNTTLKSGLRFIPFTHAFDKTIQQLRYEKKIDKQQANQEMVLNWAQSINPDARVLQPDIGDGEALFFNGKMWHGSVNDTQQTRFALLLQFATPEAAIRLPDINNFEWPFQQVEHPKPPVILVHGDDHAGINRMVQAPASQGTPGKYLMSENRIYPLETPLPLPEGQPWKPFPIYNGATANMQHFTCHVSALIPGKRPHPPHNHREEEILMVLHGEADAILPELDATSPRRRLRPGDFVYYPPHFQHTLEGVGDGPVNYLMMKWYNPTSGPLQQLAFGKYNGFGQSQDNGAKSINYGPVFEGPTNSLKKFHCHTSVLQPGAGYAPHRDPYDVAIIVLEGEVETLGQLVRPYHVIFYPAGTLHGMSNPTDKIARYVVFEFHGKPAVQGRQIHPYFSSQANSAIGNINDGRYEKLLHEYKALEASYSLKLGRGITKAVERYLGWLPPVRQKMQGPDRQEKTTK